ncbi:MAG TPA: hypothetical protein VGS01_07910 [Candidatus Limnocylindria bacterium]|nr:hypothetical protein [Candidatus Limnocylindria bacterium]
MVVYAAANAAAIALAGTAACGLRPEWYVALVVLALAMATLQTLVIRFAGLRVSARRWWPLTLGGTVSVTPLAFGVVYVFGVILLGGLATLGVEQGTEAVAGVVLMLPAAFAGVFIAGLQFFAFRSPPDDMLVMWFGANAVAGFVGAPAIENVALGCANIGIGPSWIESPFGWIAAGALGGVLTGLVLARLRISR